MGGGSHALAGWQVHRDMGNYVEAFLDLQRLRKVAPNWPGLLQLLEETATLSLGNRRNHHVPAVCTFSLLPPGAKRFISDCWLCQAKIGTKY